jgi:hypothetical protein
VGFAFPARGVWGRELRARARDFFRHARALSASSRLCGSKSNQHAVRLAGARLFREKRTVG